MTSKIEIASPSLSASSFISSVSWMKKSPHELIPMLENAYNTLKDKERDLRLAAEIGKSLLENNIALKSNYDDLLTNNTLPYPTPTNSSSSLVKEQVEEYEEAEYIPIHRTREALFEILEKENQDLSIQLETALLNQEKLDRTNGKKSRQLQNEIRFLQTSLDHATIKIQELEEKKTLTKDGCGGCATTINAKLTEKQHETLENNNLQKLTSQFEQLKIENDQMNQSKAEIEKNLFDSLHDLRVLKQQFDQFEFTSQQHNELQKSFQAQQLHVQELRSSLEEHVVILSKLRNRGITIPSFGGSLITSSSSSMSNEDEIKGDNLLTELENAWFKRQTSSPPPKRQTTSSSIFQTLYNQLPNVDLALESIILKAGVVEKDALDDALSLIDRLEHEYDHEKFLQEKRHIYYNDAGKDDDIYHLKQQNLPYEDGYDQISLQQQEPPSGGIIGYAKQVIKSMIYMTWRWLRFTLIMMIAIFINLKQGPDALLL